MAGSLLRKRHELFQAVTFESQWCVNVFGLSGLQLSAQRDGSAPPDPAAQSDLSASAVAST